MIATQKSTGGCKKFPVIVHSGLISIYTYYQKERKKKKGYFPSGQKDNHNSSSARAGSWSTVFLPAHVYRREELATGKQENSENEWESERRELFK